MKTVDDYMNSGYTVCVRPLIPEEGGGWTACVPELGRYACVGDGDTAEDAIEDVRRTMRVLIEDALEKGVPIPEPRTHWC